VFVTGQSSHSTVANSFDYATVAYDASTGAQRWVRRFNGPDDSNDVPLSVALSPDGTRVFVTGTSLSFTTSFDTVTIAYDATTGARIWRKRFNGAPNGVDEGFDVVAGPDGAAVFVTGESYSKSNDFDFMTIAYDASTGASMWKVRFDGVSHGADYPSEMAIGPDGGTVFITGATTYGPDRDYGTIAYDASDGTTRWAARYAGPYNGDAVGQAIAVSPDGGRVFVTGLESTLAYDGAKGTILWDVPLGKLQIGEGIAVSPDGAAVYAVGTYAPSTGGVYFATVAVDASTGAKRWARTLTTTGNQDTAYAVAVRPDGSEVFSAGTHEGDFVTFAYAA
jgi:hypothetical protein